MPFAYISEYVRMPNDMIGRAIPAGQEPAITVQKIAIGGGSVQSAPFSPKTTLVAINVDATCSFAFGENPTATTSSMRLPQDGTQFFGVTPGDRVAVISNS